jgi:hypothetical protein
LFAIFVLVPATRAAAACGDDIGGKRVACRCGDVVVADTRLQASDPVVSERCSTDGLVVRAKPDAQSIVLDLAGLTILGTGQGTGIRVIDGGRDGAVIVGGDGAAAEVAGFGTGFRARGQRSVRELRNVSFTANERDGVVLRGAGSEVLGVTAERNGRDGLRIGGRGTRLDGVSAQQNGGDGVRLTTPSAQVDDAVSAGNGGQQTRATRRTPREGE